MVDESRFPTVGILGGGQLGRMLSLAAIRMGLRVRFLSPHPSGSMEGLGENVIGDWDDDGILRSFAEGCAVVTAESEWTPVERLSSVLPDGVALFPSPRTIKLIKHKGVQKQCLADAGLPVPAFQLCATLTEAREAAGRFGYPVVLKKFLGSYDGYGNATAGSVTDIARVWPELAGPDGLLVEAWVPFVRELAVLVARRPDGLHAVYPVAHTVQQDHRCHMVIVPAHPTPATDAEAQRVALAAVEAVEGVGITAVELFEMKDGSVLVNELAPRPHNTGHYSIEGCYTSQFENHLRAILSLPLGSTALREPVAVMVNVLGHRDGTPEMKGYAEALAIEGVSLHLYGKNDVRANRKMGHVTVTGKDRPSTIDRALRAAELISL